MKHFILVGVGLMFLSGSAFSQCPQPGLKIISAACEAPLGLAVGAVSCNSLTVKWQGAGNESFIFKAGYAETETNAFVEITGATFSCDNKGNCTGTVPVREGAVVSWSVQSVCPMGEAKFYSSPANGPDVFIPYCQKTTNAVKDNGMHVYPNPAVKYLMVEFNARVTGAAEFKVFDINGKKVYDKSAGAVTRASNQYKLDLRSLPAGTYMLELHNNGSINQSKFVLVRN